MKALNIFLQRGRTWSVFQAVLVALVVLGLLIAFLVFSYRATEEAAETASRNEAQVLATQIDGALRRVDMSLSFIADKYERVGLDKAIGTVERSEALEHLHRDLQNLALRFPEALAILVADANGTLQASTFDELPAWGIGDRACFKDAQTRSPKEIAFSPILTSRAQDLPAVVGYRAPHDSLGAFAGVVAVALDLRTFHSLVSGIELGQRGLVSVRRTDDGSLMVRWPERVGPVERDDAGIIDSLPFRKIQNGDRSGVDRYIGVLDNVERIFGFQALEHYPFYVVVGRSVEEQFAPWRQTAYAASTLAFVSLILLLGMQAGLRSTQERLARGTLRLRQLAQAVEQSPNSIVITDTAARIEYANAAFTQITGYTAEEVFGQNPKILNAGKTSPETYKDMWATLMRGEPWRGEFINTRKDGSTYLELATIAPLKQPDGSVTHYVAVKEDVTERREAEARIRQLAFYDTLTGLPNRSLMWDRLKHAISGSERGGTWGMLLLADIDHFKLLNDTQGHDVGDALLREVALRMRSTLRQNDTIARVGDDDFAVVVEGLDTEHLPTIAHAETIAEHLHQVTSAPYELGMASGLYRGSLSIGITLFGGGALDAETILKQAEVALNRAKQDGRNAIRFFSDEMQAVVDARAELERKLRTALDEEGFRLFYQPQTDREGRTIGAEALIRCFDQQGTMLPPASFIQLAEETGLIVPIGNWVLDTACAQLQAWQQHQATRAYSLSINVSAKQFHQPDFVDRVHSALQAHRVPPHMLKLELTESVVLGDLDATVARMEQIKALGVRFALDDFGTGYSSLSYLKRLPFDQLKIDQIFVRDMALDNSSESIVCAILAISRSLELEVVAEGVETRAQHELLVSRGCEMFQGYLFGKPKPIEDWRTG